MNIKFREMKKITIILIVLSFTVNSFAQKVNKTYWSISGPIKEEFQINSNGVKNGYYKKFNNEGAIYKKGKYKNGKKTGLWTTYDMKGTGTVTAITNYLDGKMDGSYKQWCFEKGRKYLCGDYVYKKDREIKAKHYYSNGQLESVEDKEKGINNKWFKDGSPSGETVNGVYFRYDEDDGVKYVNFIQYDSLDVNYKLYYSTSYPHSLDRIIYINNSLETSIRYNGRGYGISAETRTIEEAKVDPYYYKNRSHRDSSFFSNAISLYLRAPNPNKKNEKFENYNLKTGDFRNNYNDGSYDLIHYTSDSIVEYTETQYSKEGTIQVYREINNKFKKENNKRPLIVKKYKDGKLFEVTDNKNKSTTTYTKNGTKKSKFEKADDELNRPYNIETVYYNNGQIKEEILKKGYSIQSSKEYYESGQIKKITIEKDNIKTKRDTILSKEFDENGNLIKLIVLQKGYVNTELTDKKAIRGYFVDLIDKKIDNVLIVVVKKIYNGSYYDTYEYPKGKKILKKIKIVSSNYRKEILSTSDDKISKNLLNKYEIFADKVILITSGNTDKLEIAIKKIKKSVDIEKVILEWK